MNEIRNECTLFCLDDSILFILSGISINGRDIENTERCNLRTSEREWKIIKLKESNIEIQNCFYISCFDSTSSSIILFSNK